MVNLEKKKKKKQAELNSNNLAFNSLKRRKNKIIFEIQRNENLIEKHNQTKELLNAQIDELTKKISNSKIQNKIILKKMKDLSAQHLQISKRIQSKA
jgi:uncharacterized protein YeeX (DUF496 family)